MGGKKGKGGSKPQPLSFRLYASQQALETVNVDECPGQVSNISEKDLTVKLPNNTTVPELLQWFASELTNCDVEATLLLMSGGNKEQKANITKIVSEALQEQLETQILSIGVDKLLEVKFTKAAKAAAQPPPPPAAAMQPPATPEALAAGPSATSPSESPAPAAAAAKPAQNGTAAATAEKPASPKAAPKAAAAKEAPAAAAPAPATTAAPAQAKQASAAMPPSPVKRANSGSKAVSTSSSSNTLVMAGVAAAAALAAIVGFALSRRR